MSDSPSPTGAGPRLDANANANGNVIESSADGERRGDSVGTERGSAPATRRRGSVVVIAVDGRRDSTRQGDPGTRDPMQDLSGQEPNLDLGRWATLAAAALERLGQRGELDLSFVDEEQMATLNEQHLGGDGSTDVLSFPIDPDPWLDGTAPSRRIGRPAHPTDTPQSTSDSPELPRLLGSIVICPTVAARAAPTHAGTFEDELALLVVHGALHIVGYDHDEPSAAEAMRQQQHEILSALHWNGPAPEAFRHDHTDDVVTDAQRSSPPTKDYHL